MLEDFSSGFLSKGYMVRKHDVLQRTKQARMLVCLMSKLTIIVTASVTVVAIIRLTHLLFYRQSVPVQFQYFLPTYPPSYPLAAHTYTPITSSVSTIRQYPGKQHK